MSNMELEPVRVVRVLPRENQELVPRSEAKTVAIAAAGGVLAGAATVAAVRAVSAVGARGRSPRRRSRQRERRANVIGSRSFLIDVHLLDR